MSKLVKSRAALQSNKATRISWSQTPGCLARVILPGGEGTYCGTAYSFKTHKSWENGHLPGHFRGMKIAVFWWHTLFSFVGNFHLLGNSGRPSKYRKSVECPFNSGSILSRWQKGYYWGGRCEAVKQRNMPDRTRHLISLYQVWMWPQHQHLAHCVM